MAGGTLRFADGGMDEDKDKRMDDLLCQIIDMAEEALGKRMKPQEESPLAEQGMAVKVAAPDKEHLQEGLEKAKEVIGSAPDMEASGQEDDHKSDEDRLMELLDGKEDDEDEDEK